MTKTQACKWFEMLTATQLLDNLYGRWLDESEYEDIAQYGAALNNSAEPFGLVVTKMTKRPWGCYFEDRDTHAQYRLKVSGTSTVSVSYAKVA